jgi:hypothetical protein
MSANRMVEHLHTYRVPMANPTRAIPLRDRSRSPHGLQLAINSHPRIVPFVRHDDASYDNKTLKSSENRFDRLSKHTAKELLMRNVPSQRTLWMNMSKFDLQVTLAFICRCEITCCLMSKYFRAVSEFVDLAYRSLGRPFDVPERIYISYAHTHDCEINWHEYGCVRLLKEGSSYYG